MAEVEVVQLAAVENGEVIIIPSLSTTTTTTTTTRFGDCAFLGVVFVLVFDC